jgi:hypothetical protein
LRTIEPSEGVFSAGFKRRPALAVEGGKGRTPMAVRFELRPDPLAH